jgi:predicted phage gp36 major capsid-like protein
MDVIVPHLRGIQASQAEQRLQTDQLNHNLNEFRAEMQIRFAEIRAEIAACRAEVEDVMVTLREADPAQEAGEPSQTKKLLVH